MFKKIKPATPSTRHLFKTVKKLKKKPLLKTKIAAYNRSLGKSSGSGRIVSRHKEGGAKKKYRSLDLKRTDVVKGVVCSIEHDPFRSAFIMSIFDLNKKTFFYALAADGVKTGDSVESGIKASINAGNCTKLGRIPVGSAVSNVPLTKGRGGQLARAAGTYCFIRSHGNNGTSLIDLPSGKQSAVSSTHPVLIGKVSNPKHFLEEIGKAGRSRWIGRRPSVRGVAMNPFDHPNGGGEGKKSGPGKTPWGKPSKSGKKRPRT